MHTPNSYSNLVQLSRAAERAEAGISARPAKRPRREPPFDLQRARATAFALGFGVDEVTADEAEMLPLGLSTAKYVLVIALNVTVERCLTCLTSKQDIARHWTSSFCCSCGLMRSTGPLPPAVKHNLGRLTCIKIPAVVCVHEPQDCHQEQHPAYHTGSSERPLLVLNVPACVQIRNFVLFRWREDVSRYLSEEEAGAKVNARHRKYVGVAWRFLNSAGHINFGVGKGLLERTALLPASNGTVIIVGAGLAGGLLHRVPNPLRTALNELAAAAAQQLPVKADSAA